MLLYNELKVCIIRGFNNIEYTGLDSVAKTAQPTITPRSKHNISRAYISENALTVLYRLNEAGYEAYLVGGCIRDMLLGREPKDYDVATNARPNEVNALFRNCRLVGRRFRLAHINFGRETIEVATFRAPHQETAAGKKDKNGRILRDNVFGTLEDDAMRRDFTANSLYYSIDDLAIRDYTNGMEDIKNGILKLIGDPETRYKEDPVRMLRAIRFSAKLGFRIHPDSEKPIKRLGHLLKDIPAARLYEEVLKLFLSGCAVQTFDMLRQHGLFHYLFPQLDKCLEQEEHGYPLTFVSQALNSTDKRISANKPVSPSFLFACLLWESVRVHAKQLMQKSGMNETQAMQMAGETVMMNQLPHVAIPRRFSTPMREIWTMQSRFQHRYGQRPLRFLAHPRFRAAYDFMLLRGMAGEELQETCEWWTRLQEQPEIQRKIMTNLKSKGSYRSSRHKKPVKPKSQKK